MGNTNKMTAQQLAEIRETLKSILQQAAECRAEAAVPVLVGQGFICALERDSSMAIGSAEPGSWRLVFLKHHRCGICHWAKPEADKVAAYWNEGTPENCRVKVIHYKDALREHATRLESAATSLRVRLQELGELEAA